uniref:Neurobeachin n=2 Tax=Strongyloides papillosus TaxID=174720 RepID=A0A0N5CCN9_STREA
MADESEIVIVNSLRAIISFVTGGLNSDQLNNLRLQVYLGHFSNGISAQNMLHWIQMPHSRKQEMYNYRNEKENQ